MSKPTFELAQIVSDYGTSFIANYHPTIAQQRVLNAIRNCRTSYYGGHVDKCTTCNHLQISYNSCRNRHCPKCQNVNRERWIEARKADLIPVTYFHVVFTIPHELNTYCMHSPKEMYNILFNCSKATIETFANDPKHLGAQMGMISLLHTWGQNLSLHPHVHLIVPGGGMTKAGYWKSTKSKGRYLFPIKAMSVVFKNKFMEQFRQLLTSRQIQLPEELRKKLYSLNWVVYAKQPFLGPEQVIEYLGRYTHKVAISNHRIKSITDHKISFSYKNYAIGGKQDKISLSANEFLRRFCLHILPARFMKIRHYGFLSSRTKPLFKKYQLQTGVLVKNRQEISWQQIAKLKLNYDASCCPKCKTGVLIRICSFEANAPPTHLLMHQNTNRNDVI